MLRRNLTLFFYIIFVSVIVFSIVTLMDLFVWLQGNVSHFLVFVFSLIENKAKKGQIRFDFMSMFRSVKHRSLSFLLGKL